MSDTKPQRVATVTLGDKTYDLAINGAGFSLARKVSTDFYGTPVFDETDVTGLDNEELYSLLQLLGRAVSDLQSAQAALARTEAS